MTLFIAQVVTVLVCIGMDFLTDVTWEDIFKLGASVAAAGFCKWVQVRIGE